MSSSRTFARSRGMTTDSPEGVTPCPAVMCSARGSGPSSTCSPVTTPIPPLSLLGFASGCGAPNAVVGPTGCEQNPESCVPSEGDGGGSPDSGTPGGDDGGTPGGDDGGTPSGLPPLLGAA